MPMPSNNGWLIDSQRNDMALVDLDSSCQTDQWFYCVNKILTSISSLWKCFCVVFIIWSAFSPTLYKIQQSWLCPFLCFLIRHLSLSNWLSSSAWSWIKESSASKAGNITSSLAIPQADWQRSTLHNMEAKNRKTKSCVITLKSRKFQVRWWFQEHKVGSHFPCSSQGLWGVPIFHNRLPLPKG